MEPPKAMLCDEVGLGKTIEACLIINSLINKEIIQSALFIVPDSLVNQWFIELYTKFNLSAHYIHESESNVDFDETRFLIVSSKVLKSSEKLREQIRAKNWESLVIDESHQFNLQQENSENNLLREISDTAYCSLLLSATPEILGHTNLFYQLQFLDRVKYNDINDFEKKLSDSKELSKLITIENILEKREELTKYFSNSELSLFKSNQECKQALIDRFGTGRNYFRNSRTNLERFSRLFNDRVLNPYIIKKEKIKSETDVLREKFLFISDLLESKGNEKILVICHSKKAVQYLHRKLQEISNEKMAMFHSEQSLLERDRQAAFLQTMMVQKSF